MSAPRQATANARRMMLVNEDGSEYNDSPSDARLGSAVAHATNPLPFTARAFSIGGAGTVHVITEDGTDLTIPSGALAVGMQHYLRFTHLRADSTATNIIVYE